MKFEPITSVEKPNKGYQQCTLSVMDNIADPNITFDDKGICNYYYEYLEAEKVEGFKGEAGKQKLKETIKQIKALGRNKPYDCILGLSGGVDSTYLALLAKQQGLRPLIVHFDYGWNSELAVQNIENTVKKLNFDLYTYVMDWPEFRELQRSYFKASVLDLDVPADHMIFGALYKITKKQGIDYLLSGNNVWTEHTLPKTWNYNKFDIVNLKNIHKTYSNVKLKNLPALGVWQFASFQLISNIKRANLLNYIPYNYDKVKQTIIDKLDWRDYGGKHHESVFTRFYQGYILPKKFNIDKRKAHLSNLIFAGQITKEEAEKELAEPTYDAQLQADDFEYVAKKLSFSVEEFHEVLSQPNRQHAEFGTDENQRKFYFNIMRTIKPITQIVKKIRN